MKNNEFHNSMLESLNEQGVSSQETEITATSTLAAMDNATDDDVAEASIDSDADLSDEEVSVIDLKHKRFTHKEAACFGVMDEVVRFVYDRVYKIPEEEKCSCPALTIYYFLKDKRENSSISWDIGFMCAKLGCKTEADLAKLLNVSEQEIYDLLEDEGDVEELVNDWESIEDK